MTVVGDLTVLLDANTKGLQRGLSGLRSALGGVTGLVAGLAGGAGLGALVTNGLNAADAIQKMGVRTGASAEFLSGLKNAASQSDVEFETVGKSLTRLNRSIGEFADGTKAQEEAFGALGITMKSLEGLTVDERFALVAEQLSKVKDESLAAKIGNDIFGRGFEQLRPLIADGAAGLAAFQKQAEETGQVLSKDQVDAAAKANDAMQKLQNTVGALGTQFAVGLAPQITQALGVLQANLPAIMDAAGTVFGFVAKGVDAVGTALGGIAAVGVQAFQGNFSGAAAAGGALIDDITAIFTETDDAAVQEQKRTNDLLGQVARNTRAGQPAVAG